MTSLGRAIRPPALTKRQKRALSELASHRRVGEPELTKNGYARLFTAHGLYLIAPCGYVTRLRLAHQKGMQR